MLVLICESLADKFLSFIDITNVPKCVYSEAVVSVVSITNVVVVVFIHPVVGSDGCAVKVYRTHWKITTIAAT